MTCKQYVPKIGSSLFAGVLLAASVALSGCTADFAGTSSGLSVGSPTAGVRLGGSIHGGQQPVSGSTVQLWEVGTSGYGSAAKALGSSVTTNSNGGFTYGSYTPDSGAYCYVTAAGGNPQTGTGSTTNSAIALMAALGACGNLSASTFINVNEVTTVAAVWAMAPFGKVTTGTALSSTTTTPSDSFGTNSTNLQGIANAMGVAGVLASFSTGASPGTNVTGNVSNVEYWQVNALADILALCINSTGTGSATCSPVVTATTASGGTAPADTIQMALYLAQNPTQGTSLLSQISSTAPFQPYDTSVNDWTIGYSIPLSTTSRWIAIDGFGNAWIASGSTKAFEVSPIGDVLETLSSYTVTGATTATSIGNAYQVSIDTANNPWFIDDGTPSGATVANQVIFEATGSTSAGVAGSTSGATGTALSTSSVAASGLDAVSVDGNNTVWASISGQKLVGILSGATTLTSGAPLTGNPYQIAIDLSNQSTSPNYTDSKGGSFIYTMDSNGCASTTSGAVVNGETTTTESVGGSISTAYAATSSAGTETPLNFIVDSTCTATSTNTFVANSSNVIANGSSSTGAHTFMSQPFGIAIDHSNNIWIVNQKYTQVAADSTATDNYSLTKLTAPNYSGTIAVGTATDSEFTPAGAGAELSTNYTTIYGGGLATAYYPSMDGASALWVADATTPGGTFVATSNPSNPSSTAGGLSGFTNAGAPLSGTYGLFGGVYATTSGTTTTYASRKFAAPRGSAIDLSGNVWTTNTTSGNNYVTVTVGLATPTVTPMATGIKNGTLAFVP